MTNQFCVLHCDIIRADAWTLLLTLCCPWPLLQLQTSACSLNRGYNGRLITPFPGCVNCVGCRYSGSGECRWIFWHNAIFEGNTLIQITLVFGVEVPTHEVIPIDMVVTSVTGCIYVARIPPTPFDVVSSARVSLMGDGDDNNSAFQKIGTVFCLMISPCKNHLKIIHMYRKYIEIGFSRRNSSKAGSEGWELIKLRFPGDPCDYSIH